MHGQAHHDASQIKPGQHPTAAYHDTRAARHTAAAVHVALATPTTCAVDPHPQTFRFPASLTPPAIIHHHHHHSPSSRQDLVPWRLCIPPTSAMTHDNEYPTDLLFSNARVTTFTLLSSGPTSRRGSAYLSIYVHSYPIYLRY